MRGAKHAGGARPNHYDIKLFHLSLTYQNHNRDKERHITPFRRRSPPNSRRQIVKPGGANAIVRKYYRGQRRITR